MKKILLGILIGTVIVVGTVSVGAWFTSMLTASQSLTLSVNVPESMTVSEGAITGTLTPIHGNAYTKVDQNGKSTTDFVTESLTFEFDGSKSLYFDGIESDDALAPAVRVVINNMLFAQNSYTKNIQLNSIPISCASQGKLGDYTTTAAIDIVIFLEGEDTACVNANADSSLDLKLNFHAE